MKIVEIKIILIIIYAFLEIVLGINKKVFLLENVNI